MCGRTKGTQLSHVHTYGPFSHAVFQNDMEYINQRLLSHCEMRLQIYGLFTGPLEHLWKEATTRTTVIDFIPLRLPWYRHSARLESMHVVC